MPGAYTGSSRERHDDREALHIAQDRADWRRIFGVGARSALLAAVVVCLAACQSGDPEVGEAIQPATSCVLNSQCDDGNVCTIDVCNPVTNSCVNTAISGCCNTSSDCNDGNTCTTDTCNTTTHACSSSPLPGCCTNDLQCGDGIVCTADACDVSTNTCTHTPIAGCCTQDQQCDDMNVCTFDRCDQFTHSC